jgi:hypothetical protein
MSPNLPDAHSLQAYQQRVDFPEPATPSIKTTFLVPPKLKIDLRSSGDRDPKVLNSFSDSGAS